jgi:hypothetical protein
MMRGALSVPGVLALAVLHTKKATMILKGI